MVTARHFQSSESLSSFFKVSNSFMFNTFLALILLVFHLTLHSQTTFAPLDPAYTSIIDHFEIQYGSKAPYLFSSVKPYTRKSIAHFAETLLADTTIRLSQVEKSNLKYLLNDNWEYEKQFQNTHTNSSFTSPTFSSLAHQHNFRSIDTINQVQSNSIQATNNNFLSHFYTHPNALYAVQEKGFNFQINPVLNFEGGKDIVGPNATTNSNSTTNSISINTRGFELRGTIDNKLSFYSMLTDNQVFFPAYVQQRINSTGVVPGNGFWTPFKSDGYDFYSALGYIDFNLTRHINFQFGQDKNFIGEGIRSLELSDYSAPYLFAKISTKIWHFDYENTFAEMVADGLSSGGDVNVPRKYMAMHYLSYKFSSNFALGLFESVTFGNTDSIHERGFDLNYLNPLIFYKAVENGLGAPDKDHIGIDFKWKLYHRLSLYGTIFLDEFNLAEIKANSGWWGNKQAFQLGLKYINAFNVSNLDLQMEGNLIPPYTYSHFSFAKAPTNSSNYYYPNFANYSNYDQPLAHPDGANLYELIGVARYQPLPKLRFTGKIIYTLIGLDKNNLDYGSNILLNYNNRVNEYGNYIGQGDKTDILYASLTTTYMFYHNLFADLTLIHRNQVSQSGNNNLSENIISFGLRMNIAQRTNEY